MSSDLDLGIALMAERRIQRSEVRNMGLSLDINISPAINADANPASRGGGVPR